MLESLVWGRKIDHEIMLKCEERSFDSQRITHCQHQNALARPAKMEARYDKTCRQIRHKPGCRSAYQDDRRLEISNLGS